MNLKKCGNCGKQLNTENVSFIGTQMGLELYNCKCGCTYSKKINVKKISDTSNTGNKKEFT